MKKIIPMIAGILILFTTACSGTKPSIKQKAIINSSERILFLNSDISAREFPEYPLIQASMYRGGFKKVQSDIVNIEKETALKLNATAVQAIQAKTGGEVITTDAFLENIDEMRYEKENENTIPAGSIIQIMKENQADYAIGITYQVKNRTLNTFAQGTDYLLIKMYVFDKSGNLIGKGSVKTKNRVYGGKNVKVYKALLEDGHPRIKKLVPLLI